MKTKFDKETWIEGILPNLANMSDDAIDNHLRSEIVRFLKEPAAWTDVDVWNFLKEILDIGVHVGGLSGFVIAIIDVEPYYEAPSGPGAYKQEDGSIQNAPWRKEH